MLTSSNKGEREAAKSRALGGSPASRGMQPRRRPGRTVLETTDGGWTVSQIPSTPCTFKLLDWTRAAQIERGLGRPCPLSGRRARAESWMPSAPWRRRRPDMPRSGAPLECGGARLPAHRPRTRRRHRFLRGHPSHAPVWASNRGVAGSYLVIAAGASFLPLRVPSQRVIEVDAGTETSAAETAFYFAARFGLS